MGTKVADGRRDGGFEFYLNFLVVFCLEGKEKESREGFWLKKSVMKIWFCFTTKRNVLEIGNGAGQSDPRVLDTGRPTQMQILTPLTRSIVDFDLYPFLFGLVTLCYFILISCLIISFIFCLMSCYLLIRFFLSNCKKNI